MSMSVSDQPGGVEKGNIESEQKGHKPIERAWGIGISLTKPINRLHLSEGKRETLKSREGRESKRNFGVGSNQHTKPLYRNGRATPLEPLLSRWGGRPGHGSKEKKKVTLFPKTNLN